MNKSALCESLLVLKQGRGLLSSRVTSENPSLLKGFFKFENNENLLLTLIEMELIIWVDEHFDIINNIDGVPHLETFNTINSFIVKMINDKLFSRAQKEIPTDMVISILKEKQLILEGILLINTKDDVNLNKLLYQKEKDKRLFEREFSRLLKGDLYES